MIRVRVVPGHLSQRYRRTSAAGARGGSWAKFPNSQNCIRLFWKICPKYNWYQRRQDTSNKSGLKTVPRMNTSVALTLRRRPGLSSCLTSTGYDGIAGMSVMHDGANSQSERVRLMLETTPLPTLLHGLKTRATPSETTLFSPKTGVQRHTSSRTSSNRPPPTAACCTPGIPRRPVVCEDRSCKG